MIKNGKLTGMDRVPMNYLFETSTLNCTKPLYLSNLLMFISVNVNKPLPPIVDIWKGLETKIWFIIITAFLILYFTHKISHKLTQNNRKHHSLLEFIWIYFKPLLGIGEHLDHHNYMYILWLISLIPLVEVIRNELLSNLVTRPVDNADTIDDLLSDRYDCKLSMTITPTYLTRTLNYHWMKCNHCFNWLCMASVCVIGLICQLFYHNLYIFFNWFPIILFFQTISKIYKCKVIEI